MRLTVQPRPVDLVDVFGAGWPRREPSARGHDLQPADWSVVAGSRRQRGGDPLAGQRVFLHVVCRELSQPRLLLGRGGRVDARVVRRAELRRQTRAVPAGSLAGARGIPGGRQAHDRAVFVGGPAGPAVPQEAGPALSSPPKQHEPSNRPGTNHLKPTGTSRTRRPSVSTTRSIRALLTSVLPTAAWAGQCGRCVSR